MSASSFVQRYRAFVAACVLACLLPLAAAEQPPAERPAAQRAVALAQLVRGTSTRADVERLLGAASGSGGSRLPPDWQTRDIWFYESIKTGKMKNESGAIHVDLEQDILLVFFAGDLFDGYMWYTNVGPAQGRTPF